MNAVKNFFRASAEDFKKIPGSPVAYWVSEGLRKKFREFPSLGNMAQVRQGLATGENDRFVRLWHEVDFGNICFIAGSREDALNSMKRWFPYNKGGSYRKWFGNQECIVDWEKDGARIRSFVDQKGKLRSRPQNMETYFQESVSWSKISSGNPAFRYFQNGFIYDVAGTSIFTKSNEILLSIAAVCNSNVVRSILQILSPTLNFEVGHIASLPIKLDGVLDNSRLLISKTREDWNSYETSWDFKVNPLVEKGCNLVNPVNLVKNLSALYSELRQQWADNTTEMRRLETENNRIFIEAYGLQDELTPEVPWNEITLTCNPWYRYGVKIEGNSNQELGSSSEMPMDEALEARLKSDTVKELISYAVGCMMGRYSLSKPGLILANQGSTIDDFSSQHQTLNSELSTPNLNFSPDADGIIPILDDDSFADDIVTQFHRFLRAAFGERNFNENLNFIEDALGKDIRAYFVKDFYSEHLTRYQKRPIYWLFSSPKGTFSALVYMHRYNSGTVGQVLGYLRSHITKIEARVDAADRTTADAAATQGMKSRAIKERAKLVRQLKELEDYEREIMHPLASKRIEIDLDDGVKVNYPKFGEALRKIPGMKKED